MLSAYFLRKIHSIMTNCKFVIGNEVKHLGCATWMYTRSFTSVQDDNTG